MAPPPSFDSVTIVGFLQPKRHLCHNQLGTTLGSEGGGERPLVAELKMAADRKVGEPNRGTLECGKVGRGGNSTYR